MLKLIGLIFLVVFVYNILKAIFVSGHGNNSVSINKNGRTGEVDHYEGRRCCGNCRHNLKRRAEGYWDIYCTWNSANHREYGYNQKDSCFHWEHF